MYLTIFTAKYGPSHWVAQSGMGYFKSCASVGCGCRVTSPGACVLQGAQPVLSSDKLALASMISKAVEALEGWNLKIQDVHREVAWLHTQWRQWLVSTGIPYEQGEKILTELEAALHHPSCPVRERSVKALMKFEWRRLRCSVMGEDASGALPASLVRFIARLKYLRELRAGGYSRDSDDSDSDSDDSCVSSDDERARPASKKRARGASGRDHNAGDEGTQARTLKSRYLRYLTKRYGGIAALRDKCFVCEHVDWVPPGAGAHKASTCPQLRRGMARWNVGK